MYSWLYAFLHLSSKWFWAEHLYGNHHATFLMPKSHFFSTCVTPFLYATGFLFFYGHIIFHQICLILRKCNENKKQLNVSLPFSYIPWHWLKIMKHDFNTLRIRSGSTNLNYRAWVSTGAAGAWHPPKFWTSPLAPVDFVALNTNWHPQSSFYVTSGTLTLKFLTQALYMIFKYSKRFRFAPSFNNPELISYMLNFL